MAREVLGVERVNLEQHLTILKPYLLTPVQDLIRREISIEDVHPFIERQAKYTQDGIAFDLLTAKADLYGGFISAEFNWLKEFDDEGLYISAIGFGGKRVVAEEVAANIIDYYVALSNLSGVDQSLLSITPRNKG